MTVAWSQIALEDRAGFLAAASSRAIMVPDPQLYEAAERRDERLEKEGNALDGVATYVEGPVPETLLYPSSGGNYVIIYTRNGSQVEILRIAPSRSDWKP